MNRTHLLTAIGVVLAAVFIFTAVTVIIRGETFGVHVTGFPTPVPQVPPTPSILVPSLQDGDLFRGLVAIPLERDTSDGLVRGDDNTDNISPLMMTDGYSWVTDETFPPRGRIRFEHHQLRVPGCVGTTGDRAQRYLYTCLLYTSPSPRDS